MAREQRLTTTRMDDVEDNSELRRGLPVAHAIYGIPQTINTANYVYFQAMQILLELSARGSPSGASSASGGKGKEKESDGQALMGMVIGQSSSLSPGDAGADAEDRRAAQPASRAGLGPVLAG